ncbi:hypothetical protein [Streptomyces sp. NPDC086776]|uniref:hypothetical protein n=1 Tax=Streptomyces sp. NPDC086776 TaxID=3365756 RepID=UPI0037F59709
MSALGARKGTAVELPMGFSLAAGDIWNARAQLTGGWFVEHASVTLWGVEVLDWSGGPSHPVAEVWGQVRNQPADVSETGAADFHGRVYVRDITGRGFGLDICEVRGEVFARQARILSLLGDGPGAIYRPMCEQEDGLSVMLAMCKSRVALLMSDYE